MTKEKFERVKVYYSGMNSRDQITNHSQLALDDITELIKALEQARKERDEWNTREETYGYLYRLLVAVAPQCQPDEALLGLATQIDNVLAGVIKERDIAIADGKAAFALSEECRRRAVKAECERDEALAVIALRFPFPSTPLEPVDVLRAIETSLVEASNLLQDERLEVSYRFSLLGEKIDVALREVQGWKEEVEG